MTELAPSHEFFEREDPEIAEISERLGVVGEVLGFTEGGAVGEARAAFVRSIKRAGAFDRENPAHRDLLCVYQDAAIESMGNNPEPEVAIGYQVAQARLWLELDDVGRFYEKIGFESDDGAAEMLYRSNLHPHLREVQAIVADLDALNEGPPA